MHIGGLRTAVRVPKIETSNSKTPATHGDPPVKHPNFGKYEPQPPRYLDTHLPLLSTSPHQVYISRIPHSGEMYTFLYPVPNSVRLHVGAATSATRQLVISPPIQEEKASWTFCGASTARMQYAAYCMRAQLLLYFDMVMRSGRTHGREAMAGWWLLGTWVH